MKKPEPELCPNCPLRGWIPEVIKRIRKREYIPTNTPPSAFKICMELRQIMEEKGLGACPHFNYGFDLSKTAEP